MMSNKTNTEDGSKCNLCHENLKSVTSSPDTCMHLYHYKCLKKYIETRLTNHKRVRCPTAKCYKPFTRIANRRMGCNEIKYQNVIVSDDDDTCYICLSRLNSPVAGSDACAHTFCYTCINSWYEVKHQCPVDRIEASEILVRDFPGGHLTAKLLLPKILHLEDENVEVNENNLYEETRCHICENGDNDENMLLCDRCDRGYHMYCLPHLLGEIPDGNWYCEACVEHMARQETVERVLGTSFNSEMPIVSEESDNDYASGSDTESANDDGSYDDDESDENSDSENEFVNDRSHIMLTRSMNQRETTTTRITRSRKQHDTIISNNYTSRVTRNSLRIRQ